MSSIGAMLKDGAKRLAEAGVDNADLDARVLMKHRLNIGDGALAASSRETLDDKMQRAFYDDIERRLRGEPAAYIVGRREFMGMDFLTTPAVLIPRPETEELTETALAHIPPGSTARVLDLGAGCGAIGLTIAHLRPECRVTLADCSTDALSLAKQNAERLRTNVEFFLSDWFNEIKGDFDYIVANPPYVSANDAAWATLQYEPKLALYGGQDGLRELGAVIAGAPKQLRTGGVLFVEHGAQQANAVREQFANAGFCGICCRKDLARLPRITFGVRGY